jgi:hypothetical protein
MLKESECSKCGEIYNPENFGDLHWSDDCNGAPINEGTYTSEVK